MEWLLYLIGVIIKFINIVFAAHYGYELFIKDDSLDLKAFKHGVLAIVFFILAMS